MRSNQTKVILDSGAFTVWTKGTQINLDEYISFCQKHPWISYYVNLDVIPGSYGVVAKPDEIWKSCEQGWDNYQRMAKKLPKEKIIPVFHQGDDSIWLKKMLDFGCDYVGISPANDRTTSQKLNWMRGTVKPIVLDKENKPIVGMHGFAVTSLRLMKEWQWKSVDSASWVRIGGMGSILLPKRKSGRFDYSTNPLLISVTERGGDVQEGGFFADLMPGYGGTNHYTRLPNTMKGVFDLYLKENEIGLGKWEICDVGSSYKLNKRKERWYNKKKGLVFRVLKQGIATSHICRKWLNAKYYIELPNHVPVEDLYLAGTVGNTCFRIESMIRNKLFSYHFLINSGENRRIFDYYKERVKSENQSTEFVGQT